MAGAEDFMNALMQMWPDWAQSQGLAPPADVVGNGGFPGKGGTMPVQSASPVDPQAPAPQFPPPVADATQQLPPPQDPVEANHPDVPAMNVDTATLMNGIQPGMQPTTNEQLFPTDILQIPQADIAAAPPTTPASSPLEAAAGAALSGLKTPTAPQYNLPSPPGVPGTHDVNATLMALLQAAGLTAPQSSTGLQLGSRIR